MSHTKVGNRWKVVIGALLVQLCLGVMYAWGPFATALQDTQGRYKFSETQTSIIFSVGLATFAAVMILAGRLQEKHGPRKIAIIGSLTLGVGYVLAGVLSGNSFIAMLFFIGVVGGAGIGLAYVCPIAACVKWFPDLKGLVTGLAVAGFGAGASFFVKFAGSWMGLLAKHGVSGTLVIYGIVLAVVAVAGSALLSIPPKGWKPKNWDAAASDGASSTPAVRNLTQSQIIRTAQFWMIWIAFVLSAGCGLIVIKTLKTFGTKAGAGAAAAGTALAIYSIFNGVGRITWGTISHKLGAKGSISLMAALQAAMMFLLFKMGASPWTLIAAAGWIGFNFGGNFVLFPLITAESFGSKFIGSNYGAVFTAYGIGGIIGPVLAGVVKDTMGTFTPAFVAAGVACLAAAGIIMFLRPPKEQEASLAKAA